MKVQLSSEPVAAKHLISLTIAASVVAAAIYAKVASVDSAPISTVFAALRIRTQVCIRTSQILHVVLLVTIAVHPCVCVS